MLFAFPITFKPKKIHVDYCPQEANSRSFTDNYF